MRVVPVSIAEPGVNVPRTCKYLSKSPLSRLRLNWSEKTENSAKVSHLT